MALVPALKRGAVNSDLDFFYLEDNTGVYDVTDNPTGYGNPPTNPDRNTLALFVYGYKYRKDSADEAVVIGNTIPLTVTEWQIPLSEDGYMYFKILAVPIWVTSAYTYSSTNPNIVFYQNSYYQLLADSTNEDPINNPTKWQLITDMTTDAIYSNGTIYVGSFDTVLNYRGKACYQTQMFLEAKCNCGCDKNNRNEVRPYQKIFVMLGVAGLLCAQQKYEQADNELVSLSQYCESINCTSC